MNRQFSQRIATAQNQLHTLLKRIDRLPPDEREVAAKAVEALSWSIEELHVAEEELRQQNEELVATREAVEAERRRYQELFSFAPDGYLVTDAEGVIQEANRAATRLLGASESHLVGAPMVIFVPGRERTTFYSRTNRLREEGCEQREQWEMRLQPQGGEPFPAELTVTSVQDRDGRVTGLRWLISDITARVEAEEALRATERHYRDLFEEASIGLYRTTLEGEILDANHALARILGCADRASLLEANALDFYVDPEDRARHLAQLEESDRATVEYRLRRCDGKTIWVQDTGRVERDDEGRILHVDGAIHDITERKRAEMERERLLDTLDQRATQLQTAAEVSRATSETFDPEALIRQAVHLIREQFGLYYVGLFLVDRTGEWTGEPDRWAVLRAGTGEAGRRLMERGHKLEIGASSMVGWCIANEEARIALDVGQDPVRFDTPELPATRSELALPLISRGEVLGGLTIQSAEEAAFADDDIAVLQAMADQLANAIKGARLYERAQREIAERKQAEEALRESEARYRDIAASIPGALYQFRMAPDGDLGITYMSEGAEEVLAQPLEKLKDPSFLFSTVHPDDLASLRASIDDSARQVAPWQHEFRVVKPNGQVAWVHGSSSPRRLPDGSILWNGVLLDISERKRAGQALRESEERYRAVSDLMSDFAYAVSLDPDATYTLDWATKPFDAFTSYSRDEMETQGGWLNLIHPDDREEARRYFHTLLRTGQPDAIEFRIVTRGGEERWVYNRSHPVWDEAEERVVRIIGAAQDITERKRAEKALQEYARKHAGLYTVTAAAASSLLPDEMLPTVLEETIAVAGADAGWVVLPGEPPCVAASQGVPDSLANAETCQGSDYLSRLPALELADRPAELGTMTEAPHPVAEAHKGFDDVVCVPLTAYGQMMGFLHLARQDPDAAAELDEGLLSTIGRQIGIALRNAQLYQQARQVDRLQAVNEITTAVVSSLEMDEVLCQILEKTCRALGAAEGSVLLRDADTGELVFAMTLEGDGNDLQGMHLEPGQGVAGWVAEHDRAVYVNDVEQDARFCEAIDAVTGFETHSLLCAPMGHRGEMLGVLEFVNKQDGAFDDEDLKLLEAVASIAAVALKNARFYGDLKQLLREREETQAQMIHTEKMSALGRLMASIAHEINNPLQAVDGYLSLAEEKLDDPGRVDALRRYLRIAGEEVDRISDIVSRTRDFYRPEREGFWDVDVETLIENVLLLTRKKLEHSDVTVEHTGPEELPTVEANADQLKQVFLNLVINAVEAMPEGGTLYIRTALEREADVVRIEFEDTGVGMSQEMMDQVFEPFVTTKEEGTGLGMSISYGIVQAHNGAIAVSSEKGAGTTFTIRLPLEQPEP